MKKYSVRLSYDGWRYVDVEAGSKQEAFDKAFSLTFNSNDISWQLNTEFRDEDLDIEEI